MTEASSKGVMKLKPTMFLIDQPDTTHANESNNRLGGLRRRKLIKGMAVVGLGLATSALRPTLAAEDSPSSNSGRI